MKNQIEIKREEQKGIIMVERMEWKRIPVKVVNVAGECVKLDVYKLKHCY